jgi:broad specificity phosphatase PhoE
LAAKTIYLLRHGDVASRYAGRFIGRTNVPLSRAGRRQACRLARRFGNLAGLACVASPLRRARDTARLAVPGMNGDLKIWPGLREIDFGRWEGLTFDEIRRRDPARVNDWARFGSDFRFPEGESLWSCRTAASSVR